MKLNKYGIALIAFAALFIASPFLRPGLMTIFAFFIGWVLLVVGVIILFKVEGTAKWRYKRVCAIILRKQGDEQLYDFLNYNPNDKDNLFLPKKIRDFAFKPEYFVQIPARGWFPGKKDNSRWSKFKRFVWPVKTGYFIFDMEAGDVVDEKTGEKRGMPITHNSAHADYEAVTPEMLKMVVESKLAQNWFRGIDRKVINGRIWIFAIIGIVALGVVLKLAGVF